MEEMKSTRSDFEQAESQGRIHLAVQDYVPIVFQFLKEIVLHPHRILFRFARASMVAMAPDGRAFITAVAGDKRITVEGNPGEPWFTPDIKTICYRLVKEAPNESAWYRDPGELRVAERMVLSGKIPPPRRGCVLPGGAAPI